MTTTSPPSRRLSRRATIAAVIGAALLVVAAAASIFAFAGHRPSQAHPVTYSSQVALPFTSLEIPTGVAVDGAGNTYVTDYFTHQVWKLAAGATVPTPMPFAGLTNPNGVTVDSEGSLYITDEGNNRVLKLAAGESNPTVLPFTGSKDPDSVAVDADGNVYVTDYHDPCAASKPPCFSSEGGRVLKLAAGASTPTVLPLTGLSRSWGVAADSEGNVYVADSINDRVLKLPVQESTRSSERNQP